MEPSRAEMAEVEEAVWLPAETMGISSGAEQPHSVSQRGVWPRVTAVHRFHPVMR